MSAGTCQSFVVQQIKQNDGNPWPGQDQGHNQKPGHWRAKGHDHFIQKRCVIGRRWRRRLPALSLTAHRCTEPRRVKKANGGREHQTSSTKLLICWPGITDAQQISATSIKQASLLQTAPPVAGGGIALPALKCCASDDLIFSLLWWTYLLTCFRLHRNRHLIQN